MSLPKKEIEKSTLIIRLNFLVLGLGLVIYAIYFLNTRGLPTSFSELFQPSDSIRISWCETRVEALTLPSNLELYQEGYQWLSQRGEEAERELNFIEVEKWFGRYCRLRGLRKDRDLVDIASLSPALHIKFITGQEEVIYQDSDQLYVWRDRAFKSEELTVALRELEKLN